jgi:predicted HNH restriction endonuclease
MPHFFLLFFFKNQTAISKGHWKIQNNMRIYDKNQIFRAAVEHVVVPSNVELTPVVNWYHAALAGQRVSKYINNGILTLVTRNNVESSWGFEFSKSKFKSADSN